MTVARLAGLAGVLLVTACGDTGRDSATVAEIRALIERTEQANNNGDVAAWVALFADTAVYMPAGQPPVSTREGLLEAAQSGFSSWRSSIRIEPVEIVPAGEWAFARTRVTGTATPVAGGESVTLDLKQLIIYQRQADGSWRIARLIGNPNG